MTVKVLILEDNPVARGFLRRVVRESFSDDMSITEAGDLESARRHLALAGGAPGLPAGEAFQLVLVDLDLPNGNGLELLAELARYPAHRVVTTLYADDDHLFSALHCGADGYLLKEDRFELLVEELQKIVRGQPPLSPAIARRLLAHFRGVAPEPAQDEQDALTPRESEVLNCLSKGFTIKEIAGLLNIKWFTVNGHIKSIYKKLSVSSGAEAAVLAGQQGPA